jgi:transposase
MDTSYANRLRWFRQFKEQINSSKNTLIVGVDISKDKHHAFLSTPAGRTLHRRLIFENSIEGFSHLLFYIKRYLSDEQLADVVIGVEPTSMCHKPLAEYLISRGYSVPLYSLTILLILKFLHRFSPDRYF